MWYKIFIWLKKPSNTLWVMPALGAVIAIVFAFMAFLGTFYLPPELLPDIKRDILQGLLDIIASSMLAVITFSLSIMVSAFSSASANATPRATELIMADDNTRITIASFISAFIYAVIAKIALGLEYYGQNGRFILFISTATVLVYLIYTLIKWVHTLSHLGRLGNTLDKIYKATAKAMKNHALSPNLGACWNPNDKEPDMALYSKGTGYLTHMNLNYLYNLSKKFGFKIFIDVRSGDYIFKGDELAFLYFDEDTDLNAKEKESMLAQIYESFVIETQRSFEQDPRFGLIVLSEVAQRALFPAVNDPGTAFSVLNLIARLLLDESVLQDKDKAYIYDRIGVKDLDISDFITQSIDAIARDGASNVEVALRVQKTLFAVYKNSEDEILKSVSKAQAKTALDRSLSVLVSDFDKARLSKKYGEFFG